MSRACQRDVFGMIHNSTTLYFVLSVLFVIEGMMRQLEAICHFLRRFRSKIPWWEFF